MLCYAFCFVLFYNLKQKTSKIDVAVVFNQTTCLGKKLFIRFTVRVFCERFNIFCVCPSFPFSFDDWIWDLIRLIPDQCLFIYFTGSKLDLTCFETFGQDEGFLTHQ